jgi:hypothetical protein
MTREQQIEQMARITCQMYCPQYEKRCAGVGACDYKCLHYQRCEALYEAGYRKQSETAETICKKIMKDVNLYTKEYKSAAFGSSWIEQKVKDIADQFGVKMKGEGR